MARCLQTVLAVLILGLAAGDRAPAQSPPLTPGESIQLGIPKSLKGVGSREGYFYTPGGVTVAAYTYPAVVTIRDPAAPEPPVGSAALEQFNPTAHFDIPAGFYYISVTEDAGILVGASDVPRGNGYYHYRSSAGPYANEALATRFFIRGIGGIDNKMVVFSPLGSTVASTCCDTICLENCGEFFSILDPDNWFEWSPGNLFGVLGVHLFQDPNYQPVQVLARDGPGYFVPQHSAAESEVSVFRTMLAEGEFLNIHSFADGTEFEVRRIQNPIFQKGEDVNLLAEGTLADGETFTFVGLPNVEDRMVKVTTTKAQASVSVLGGVDPIDGQDYLSHVLDPAGNFQGTDFITRSHDGGFIHVTGLSNETAVEIRDASTAVLQSAHAVGEAMMVNVNPGPGIWRIRADKEVTVAVGHGAGATFIPLTENVSGTTPFPPVIAGIRWNPYFPRTSDTEMNVSFLTDEACTAQVQYKIGEGPWYRTSVSPLGTEHLLPIIITGLTEETLVRFRPEARDQSGSVTVDNNGGQDYVVRILKDAPNLEVSLVSAPLDPSEKVEIPMTFRIQNLGDGEARGVTLTLDVEGLQPTTPGVTCDYSSISSNRIRVTLPAPNVPANGSRDVVLNLWPFFSHTGSVNYRLLSCSSSAQDFTGRIYPKNHPAVNHDYDDGVIEMKFRNSDYAILANLRRFFNIHPQNTSPAQRTPLEMAAFAARRGAALAYISTGDVSKIRDYIQGNFGKKIYGPWNSTGHLILVGCSSIMPAYGWNLSCTFGDDVQVWMSDNTYANLDHDGKHTPELILGRVTGRHPDTFSAVFQRALTPSFFDKALAVSGTGDGEDQFSSSAREGRNLLDDLYDLSLFRRLKDIDEAEHHNTYKNNVDNTDFLYYRNHGYVGGWEGLDQSQVSGLSFGSKYPIVYSNACLTGKIQNDNNLAESFLTHHAAAFIGATELSPRSANNSLGKKILSVHKKGYSIGRAFRDGKRSLAGDIHWYTVCAQDRVIKRNLLTYNLYGDPLRGAAPGYDKGLEGEEEIDPPIPNLGIDIPLYVVERDPETTDFVYIPDDDHGGHLDVLNEPLVPSYRVTRNYEPGIRVHDVRMVSRSGQTNESGLNLPLSWWNQKVIPGPGDVPSPGTFPSDDFHWTTLDRMDGGQEFLLTVHPFFYNATTQDATFYQTYAFEIDFVTSTVVIDSVTATYDSIPLGQQQDLQVPLRNTGEADVRVNLVLEIYDLGTNAVMSSQSQNNLLIPANDSIQRQFNWDPTGSPATDYQAEIEARDPDTGAVLAVGYSQFRFGTPLFEVKSLTLDSSNPGYLDDGEAADISMRIQNVGDVPNEGTMTIQIRNSVEGDIVAEWEHRFSEVIPDATLDFTTIWNSGALRPGVHRMIGWVDHRGGTTDQATAEFQTTSPMRWGWEGIQDVYGQGDKIVGAANLFHSNGKVVGLADSAELKVVRPNLAEFDPGLASHPDDPHYSTQFVVSALDPSGIHSLVIVGSKIGYRDAIDTRWFVVADEPFEMTATPPTALADGSTTVRVESAPVLEEGVPIVDGTLMTVNPLAGSIASPDVAPGTPGIQIASSGGRFGFDWRAPTQPALPGFLHGFLGGDRPQSGVSAVFKGIDFNGNRRVDIADIAFIRTSEGAVLGGENFDDRKDLNGDGIIDATDAQELFDRWALEFAGAPSCPTCPPDPKSFGVKIRPVPDRALIPPGGSLDIEIVAEGLSNFGGYEFGAVLVGDSLDWMGEPTHNTDIESVTFTQTLLGPEAYGGDGWRIGAMLSGEKTGPGGMHTLAVLKVTAGAEGETRLILSSPVLVRLDGAEQEVLQAVEGIYEVGLPTATPTSTPTASPTMEPTPTVTPGSVEGYDLWPPPNGDGRIDSRDLLEWLKRVRDDDAEGKSLFDFAQFWY